jgi:hypothetical protein
MATISSEMTLTAVVCRLYSMARVKRFSVNVRVCTV